MYIGSSESQGKIIFGIPKSSLKFCLTVVPKRCKFGTQKGGDAQLNAEFRHRMPDELHKRIKALSEEYGTSVTGLINVVLKDFADGGGIPALEKRISEIEKEIQKLKNKK